MSDRGPCSPVGCGIGVGRIGSEEFRLAKAGRDGSIFDTTELF
jgi:hypothetical protein